jgi:hypothetical protein
MAGDWVKMRASLSTDPKVASIARAVGAAAGEEFARLSRASVRLLVIGGLHAVWSAANEHASDGLMKGLHPEDLDDLAGLKGIGDAMVEVGWAVAVKGGVMLPNFTEWNRPAEDRTNADRQRRHRERAKNAEIPEENEVAEQRNGTVTRYAPLRNGVTVTTEKRREEKREEYIPAAPVPTSKPRNAVSSPAKARVTWSAEAGWAGIEDQDRTGWAVAFPGAVLDQELAKAHEWLKANPKRAGRRNWRKFLVGWLQRCQDRGGTHRDPGRRPADDDSARRAALDRKAAEFANLKPAPYRRPSEVAGLSVKRAEEYA